MEIELNEEMVRNIQVHSNWCWAAACMMVGLQYKKLNPKYDFNIGQAKGTCTDDAWQRAIVMNANTVMPGQAGDFAGDDEAKVRGLKYVVTGDCDSSVINVANLGIYDMQESLLDLYGDEIRKVFQSGNYIIGNAVLYPKEVCHSFVLMDMENGMVQVYDPWDGSIRMYKVSDVFEKGFLSVLGIGVIKWMQYIVSEGEHILST